MYILPVLGSGADADNGMAHLVTFIHSSVHPTTYMSLKAYLPLLYISLKRTAAR
jgi:hypothetical protein